MNKMRQQHIKEIKNLFKEFTSRIVDAIAKCADANAADFSYKFENVVTSGQIENFKNTNNIMYKFGVNYSNFKIPMFVLASEELILVISDILMGGKGNVSYTGNLSEIQINSSLEIITSALKSVKEVLEQRYQKIIDFDTNIEIIKKDNPEFNKSLEDDTYNLCFENNFNIYKKKDYPVIIMTNEQILIESLSAMNLLSFVDEIKVAKEPMKNLNRISNVKVKLTAELGRTRIPIKKTLELGRGSIIELDQYAGEDIKIYANEIEIAEAKVVAVDDYFGVQITKILTKELNERV